MPRPSEDNQYWQNVVFHPAAYMTPPYTVEVPNASKRAGETIPRRHVDFQDELSIVPEEGIDTLHEVFKRSANKFRDRNIFGKRKLIKMHVEVDKVQKLVDGVTHMVDREWSYYELGPYEWMTFGEFEQYSLELGSSMAMLGLQKSDRVHIYAATHPYWQAFAHGAWSQNIPVVTVYDTLGVEGLKHSLVETDAKAIFLDPGNMSKLSAALSDGSRVQYVIYNDDDSPVCQSDPKTLAADLKQLKKIAPTVKVYSFTEFRKLSGKLAPTAPPKPSDLACIMYTSGSTGPPKGVLITHRNIVAAIAGLHSVVGRYLRPDDSTLLYLPLAHIFELAFESTCMYWGGEMCYGHPRTLSDAFVKNCRGDINEGRPSVMIGVPAVWESVKKAIIAKVNAMPGIVQSLFWGAITAKAYVMPYLAAVGLSTSLMDKVVFRRVRAGTGGRLRVILNGGGPIARETQDFISNSVAPLIIGYGLTETCAMGALMDPYAWTNSAAGALTGSVEMKLVDWAEAGYLSTDNPPRGEICIRGPPVASGYLNNEKATAESFTPDGWFLTGDIGTFDALGNLRIIDRKKNLVKTLNGEYIALEKLESVYRSCPAVHDVCVHAPPDRSKPIAFVCTVERFLENMTKTINVQGKEGLSPDDSIRTALLTELQKVGRAAGLAAFEIIDGLIIDVEEWTLNNGLITSSQKLNRRALLERFGDGIATAYGKHKTE